MDSRERQTKHGMTNIDIRKKVKMTHVSNQPVQNAMVIFQGCLWSEQGLQEKSSHPTLSLMMILLAEEDIFLPVQPAQNKGYEGDE
ncbi:hypothetical protein AAES_76422 [Amazona aestiva]|uniref:Uncharacterized protein n=1 Tax=Amazona aestiva TaxID=12930 RepID=A0A0Q3USS4_AMAAE|nr:hypothetical protein AAES_76422 [Amazona aestiva]